MFSSCHVLSRLANVTLIVGGLMILPVHAMARDVDGRMKGEPTSFQVSQSVYTTAPYANILSRYVDARGNVNYAMLKRNGGDLIRYNQILARTPQSTYNSWSNAEKIAFWINAYNALTLESIVKKYPVSSIKKISGVWNRKKHQVLGKMLTLDDIEHNILRKQFNEPRIHMALVCASKGCPPLLNKPFTGSQLNAQLNGRAKAFVADPSKFRIDRKNGRVYLSSIFKWYGQDFEKKYGTSAFAGSNKQKASLNFLSQYTGRDAAYLKAGKYGVSYLNYDWSLNKQ